MARTIPKELKSLANIKPRSAEMSPREIKKLYTETKKLVREHDSTNLQYLVFYYREKNFWQIGDHSMLIYRHLVARRCGIKHVNIRADSDYNFSWHYGYVTIADIKSIKTRLLAGGLELVTETPEVLIFKIEKPVDKDQMAALEHTEENKRAQFNNLVVPCNVYPKVLKEAGILQRDVINCVVNLGPARRDFYGARGAELACWLSYYAIRMSNGSMNPETYFTEAIEKSKELNDWFAFVNKFETFDIDRGLKMAMQNQHLQQLLKSELKVILSRKTDAEENES